MKSVTVRELRSAFLKIEAMLLKGQEVAASFHSAIAYPLLTELELTNTRWCAVD
jgi:hypothetical protein